MKNIYSPSRIEREFGISIANRIILFLELKPVEKGMHAGKPCEFYSEEDKNRIVEFCKKHTRKERFQLFKEKWGEDFGPKNDKDQQEKRKQTLSKKWGITNILKKIFGNKRGKSKLRDLVKFLFQEDLDTFLKEENWDKVNKILEFKNSKTELELKEFFGNCRGYKIGDRGGVCKKHDKMKKYWKTHPEYASKMKNVKKESKKRNEASVDKNIWVTREDARKFLGKNDTTTYSYYKLYGLEFLKKGATLFYKKDDLIYLKNILNSKKQNLGQVHNALNERLLRSNIVYDRERKFEGCGNRRFDFYLPEKRLAIEVQGSQHFSCNCSFMKSKKLNEEDKLEILKAGIKADQEKIDFCKRNSIDLIWITTKEDVNLFFEKYLIGQEDELLQKWFHRGHLDLKIYIENKTFWMNFHKSLSSFSKMFKNPNQKSV